MRLLADLHISPRTVSFLRSLGHDVVRVSDIMAANSPDTAITMEAKAKNRIILTQDLDFSDIIALSGESKPSLINLRLHSSRIENVNQRLSETLPLIDSLVEAGVIVTIEDANIRHRNLPIR